LIVSLTKPSEHKSSKTKTTNKGFWQWSEQLAPISHPKTTRKTGKKRVNFVEVLYSTQIEMQILMDRLCHWQQQVANSWTEIDD